MTINTETRKYFSISSKPGNFGATIYNNLFKRYSINALYLPLQLKERDRLMFPRVIQSLKELGASGISVSMPYKKQAALHAKNPINKLLNVNTLISQGTDAQYLGYNTDAHGFEHACESIIEKRPVTHIAGHGCVAHSIGTVLHRRSCYYKQFSVRDGMDTDLQAQFIVNATPVGMKGVKDKLFTEKVVARYDYVFDAVVTPPGQKTRLIQIAEALNKPCVPGYKMSAHQLHQQFMLYTRGMDIGTPEEILESVLHEVREMGYEI